MVDLSWKTIKFNQQTEFQSFKIIQDFKKVHMLRFFFWLVYIYLAYRNSQTGTSKAYDEVEKKKLC